MTLLLPVREEGRIRAHGEAGYPEEVCGVLLGVERADGTFVVEEARPMGNQRKENRGRRYVIDPLRLLEVEDELEAEGNGRRILGFYHTHPDHPAAPSGYDREHAWPNLSYVILRVAEGRAEALTSWRLREDRGGMVEEPVRPG